MFFQVKHFVQLLGRQHPSRFFWPKLGGPAGFIHSWPPLGGEVKWPSHLFGWFYGWVTLRKNRSERVQKTWIFFGGGVNHRWKNHQLGEYGTGTFSKHLNKQVPSPRQTRICLIGVCVLLRKITMAFMTEKITKSKLGNQSKHETSKSQSRGHLTLSCLYFLRLFLFGVNLDFCIHQSHVTHARHTCLEN